jgi:pyruvate/2-oxoglutarate dehydrogenase complex dihydrolipoamide dehydrogenase (E3) component
MGDEPAADADAGGGMDSEHFDYLVIGGGSGGYAAARTAREVREKVAIIDGSEELGGLCILRGCMPSKTLIYAAEVLHLAQRGERFGLRIPEAAADMKALHRRKQDVIGEFADYRREQLKSDRYTLFRQRARFVGPQTVELDDGRRLTADEIMLATGSVVATPPVPGFAEIPAWTSDDVLELDFVPPRVIVLGGGVVACELAQFLRRIGSEVVQIQRSPHLLTDSPPEAAEVIAETFRAEGIELFTDTRMTGVAHADGGFRVDFIHAGETKSVHAPHLLNGLGRRPAIDGLGLEVAGIETRPGGHIICDAMQRTSNPRVRASGDVTGPHEIVHIAVLQGELAARDATGRDAQPIDYDALTSVIFTDPQLATVGRGENALKQAGIEFLAADYPFDDHGKSILMEAKRGYVKVFCDRAGVVLGAECVAKDAGELIHSMAVAVSLGARVADLLKVHWYHPTLSEIWTYPLEDLLEAL